jgi:hypothetical protein
MEDVHMVDQITTHDSPSATPQAKDAAAKVTDEASTQASELTAAAKDHAGAVVSEAKEQARSVVKDAQGELQSQAEQQARRVGEGLGAASTVLRSMADGGEPGVVTDLTRQLAGTLDRVSTRIGEGGLRAVGDDLRGFARRQPGLFLLGAGVAGFLVTRAVRAAGMNSDSSLPGPLSTVPPVRTPDVGTTDPAGVAAVPTPVP